MNSEVPKPYALSYSRAAIRTMRKLPKNISDNVAAKVSALAADPMAANNNVTRLQGVPGFRLRVGDWRVLYEIDHSERCLHVDEVVRRGEDYKP